MNTQETNLRAFSFPVRIYYEDTDAAGVVYYANYFKYFERCRTEWMRLIGYDQSQLTRKYGLVFVVRSVEAEYLRPAHLDDQLTVTLEVETLGRSLAVFRQRVLRDGEELVTGTVKVVCVNIQAMKAAAIPGELRQKLESSL
jgi:acyl-CoA thioester hydrolase